MRLTIFPLRHNHTPSLPPLSFQIHIQINTVIHHLIPSHTNDFYPVFAAQDPSGLICPELGDYTRVLCIVTTIIRSLQRRGSMDLRQLQPRPTQRRDWEHSVTGKRRSRLCWRCTAGDHLSFRHNYIFIHSAIKRREKRKKWYKEPREEEGREYAREGTKITWEDNDSY